MKQQKITYKCNNYRKTNKINNTKMCKATIIGLRNENNLKEYRFFLKENHSNECLLYYKNLIDELKF